MHSIYVQNQKKMRIVIVHSPQNITRTIFENAPSAAKQCRIHTRFFALKKGKKETMVLMYARMYNKTKGSFIFVGKAKVSNVIFRIAISSVFVSFPPSLYVRTSALRLNSCFIRIVLTSPWKKAHIYNLDGARLVCFHVLTTIVLTKINYVELETAQTLPLCWRKKRNSLDSIMMFHSTIQTVRECYAVLHHRI